MASDWKRKIRFGHSVMPKRVIDTSKPDNLTQEYRKLYPGVRSDHLPDIIIRRNGVVIQRKGV